MLEPKIKFNIPTWAGVLYILGSMALVPWTVFLDFSLRSRHLFRHWDIAWVGLDVGLIISLLLTGLLAYRKSLWVVMAATLTGGFLLVDAWFDVLGAHSNSELFIAVIAAVFIELPLAMISLYLAHKTLRKAYHQ